MKSTEEGKIQTLLRLTIAAYVLAFFKLSTAAVQAQFNFENNNKTITTTG